MALVLQTLCTLLRHIRHPLLPYKSAHLPIQQLVRVCVEVGSHRVQASLVSLLWILWNKIREDPSQLQFFFETPGQMATDKDSQTVAWSRDAWSEGSAHVSMGIGTARQEPFRLTDYWVDPRQPAEHIDWGQAHLTLPHALPASRTLNASSWMGSSNLARSTFAASGALPGSSIVATSAPCEHASSSGTTAAGSTMSLPVHKLWE